MALHAMLEMDNLHSSNAFKIYCKEVLEEGNISDRHNIPVPADQFEENYGFFKFQIRGENIVTLQPLAVHISQLPSLRLIILREISNSLLIYYIIS